MRLGAGLLIIALLTAILSLSAAVNPMTAGFVYLITVLLIAARWGLLEAVSASVAATLCLNYFFLPPVGTLHIEDADNWIALSAFLVTSLVASQLSEMARRSHDMASRAEAAKKSEQFRSTLLDAVAHEFKTPLTSIRAATSTILTAEPLTPNQQHELLTIIDQEASRLSRLMTEAFHLARADSEKMHLSRKMHDVGSLVQETLKQTATGLNGRRIQIQGLEEAPRISVDGELVIVALKQLVENAVKYSTTDSPVRIRVEASPDAIWLRVHNQGPGLTERERSMVFDRFYRSPSTSQSVAGTGIGLAIAQDIVKAHGGFIDVESGPGMGTEFSMRLPLLKADS